MILVSKLESDGLGVSLGPRLETGKGSELSLGLEIEVGDGNGAPDVRACILLLTFGPFPSPTVKEVLAVPNSILELPCPQSSALASYHWSHGVEAIPEAINSEARDSDGQDALNDPGQR